MSSPTLTLTPWCLQVGACGIPNHCCQADLNKVEVLIGNTCWGAVQYATVNGGPQRPVSYTAVTMQRPLAANYTTVKLTGLALPSPTAAAGAQVCFKLLDSGSTPCSTAQSLCGHAGGQCFVSLFNAAADCCPTSLVSPMPAAGH